MSCKKWKNDPFSVSDDEFKKMKKKCKSDKFDLDDCHFFELTSINPATMRKISSEKNKKKLSNKCLKTNLKQLTLEDICKKWRKDPFVNPRTNRKLSSEKSKVYKSLEKECKPKKSSPKKDKQSQKREERKARDLIPFDEVKKEIEKLQKYLYKCKTEDDFDDWELEFDQVIKKKDKLLANTLELDEYKKMLKQMIIELNDEFDEYRYETEKKNKKKKK